MKRVPFFHLSVGCVLAAYPALRVPAPGVLILAIMATGLLAAGGITRRYRLLTWSANVVVLEYCVSLVLGNRHPGRVEPVIVGLGILAFLELNYLNLLSFTPSRARTITLMTTGNPGKETLSEMVKANPLRGLGRRFTARIAIVAAICMVLSVAFQELTRGVNLPASFTFPLLVIGASLAALSLYWLTAISLLDSVAARYYSDRKSERFSGDPDS